MGSHQSTVHIQQATSYISGSENISFEYLSFGGFDNMVVFDFGIVKYSTAVNYIRLDVRISFPIYDLFHTAVYG